jgi:hypothetical protein
MPRRVWFHLIASTYGSWLPGDPRGFRTWHHSEHIEGDYRNPPPEGLYDERQTRAKRLLKQPPIVIPSPLRAVVGTAILEHLHKEDARVLSLAVGGQHCHAQFQWQDSDAREPFGRAKLHAWHALRKHGWTGKLWAQRPKVIRIRDRGHQKNLYHYVLSHRDEGAWVYSELEEQ